MEYRQRPDKAAALLFVLLALGSIVLFLAVAIGRAHQPLLEGHAFRQTQTAISSYWMIRNGFALAYETPVAGAPWALPFEFPLYQAIVAGVTGLGIGSLDANGRIVSAVFLLACLAPAALLVRRLGLRTEVALAFAALMLTSPQYFFWGRTFLIETAALFFGLSFVALAAEAWQPGAPTWILLLASISGALAGLQKSTTFFPIAAVVSLIWLARIVRQRSLTWTDVRTGGWLLAAPMIVTVAWTKYADVVRQRNPFGAAMTSSLLTDWSFGSVAQRLDLSLWKTVLWDRILRPNGGGIIGVILLSAVLIYPAEARVKKYVAASLALLWLPVAVFFNLHAIHDYYQTSNVIFLSFALALVVGEWLPRVTGSLWAGALALLILTAMNLQVVRSTYWWRIAQRFDAPANGTMSLTRVVRERTPADGKIAVFGLDWSSVVPYYAERRAIAVPGWWSEAKTVWREPQSFLGGERPAAIVVCPDPSSPSTQDVDEALGRDPEFSEVDVAGCRVLLRHTPAVQR